MSATDLNETSSSTSRSLEVIEDSGEIETVECFAAQGVRCVAVRFSLVYGGMNVGFLNFVEFDFSMPAKSLANAYSRQDVEYNLTIKLHGKKDSSGAQRIAPETVHLPEILCSGKKEVKQSGILTFRTEMRGELDPLLRYAYTKCSCSEVMNRGGIRELHAPNQMYADILFEIPQKSLPSLEHEPTKTKRKRIKQEDGDLPGFDRTPMGNA